MSLSVININIKNNFSRYFITLTNIHKATLITCKIFEISTIFLQEFFLKIQHYIIL